MSTNSYFTIPEWLPLVFFGIAFIISIAVICDLLVSWQKKKRQILRKKEITDRLGNFYLDGELIKNNISSNEFTGDSVSLVRDWSESLKEYFLSNSDYLGTTKLLMLRPRQSDWFVYNQETLLSIGMSDERIYSFRHISIELEKLLDLLGELLK